MCPPTGFVQSGRRAAGPFEEYWLSRDLLSARGKARDVPDGVGVEMVGVIVAQIIASEVCHFGVTCFFFFGQCGARVPG